MPFVVFFFSSRGTECILTQQRQHPFNEPSRGLLLSTYCTDRIESTSRLGLTTSTTTTSPTCHLSSTTTYIHTYIHAVVVGCKQVDPHCSPTYNYLPTSQSSHASLPLRAATPRLTHPSKTFRQPSARFLDESPDWERNIIFFPLSFGVVVSFCDS